MRILPALALAVLMTTVAATAQALNPQPEPPGHAAAQVNNAQPATAAESVAAPAAKPVVTPRTGLHNNKKNKATWAAGSDSGESHHQHGLHPTWAAGSDSGSDGHTHTRNLGPGLGSIHLND